MGSQRASGACLCGVVQFTIELPTVFCGHCHCSMCRRNHGAGFVTWIGARREGFSVDAGTDALVRYQSSPKGSRTFCGRCGTSLFCENAQHPELVDIPLANLADPIDREPSMHFYFDHRADWVVVKDALPRLGGESGFEPLEPDEGIS